jgi:NAD(P)-dependent dehydrogenase (short-subunit alcohol dehydrogenase family)
MVPNRERWSMNSAHESGGRFTGMTAVVTGASRGIGLAIARRLLDEGASVCITARHQPALDLALEELGCPGRLIAVAGGADDPAHREEAVSRTSSELGPIRLLVNNAATNPLYGPAVEAELDAFRKLLDVNTVAPLGWIQAVHRSGMSIEGGVVLNVASAGGLIASEWIGPYNISKAALIHLTRQLALELAPTIRVNAIAPAVVKTRFAQPLYENGNADLSERYPLGRLGEPEDVASLAAFLLSDEAAWITGQTVVADGGIGLSDAGGRRASL